VYRRKPWIPARVYPERLAGRERQEGIRKKIEVRKMRKERKYLNSLNKNNFALKKGRFTAPAK
jgi:hypothetical protein